MRGAHLMSDGKDLDEPVVVTLKATVSRLASQPTFTKDIEIDRQEWLEMDPEARRQDLDDRVQEFLNEVLDADFEIQGDASLDDPVLGE